MPERDEVMEAVFINHTNHPSAEWSDAQSLAAKHLGRIVDLTFPDITSDASEQEIQDMAHKMAQKIERLAPVAVLCQGEFTYTYALVYELLAHGICVMAACSERVVEEIRESDGSTRRVSRFRFTRFRRYGYYKGKHRR